MAVGGAAINHEAKVIKKWLGDLQPAHEAYLDTIKIKNKKFGNTKKDPSKNYAKMLNEWIDSYEPTFETIVNIRTKSGAEIDKKEMKRNPPPYLFSFCDAIGILKDTLYVWAEDDEELARAISRYKGLYELAIAEGSATGAYNARWTQFEAQNSLNWTNKNDIKSGGEKIGSFVGVNMTSEELDNAAAILVARIVGTKGDVDDSVGDPRTRCGKKPGRNGPATHPKK